MENRACDQDPQFGVNAAFMRNHRGEVCITFSDPSYVRAESVLIDPESLAVYAILHESCHLLGYVSEEMAQAFENNDEALLTALRHDGTIMELVTPIEIGNA